MKCEFEFCFSKEIRAETLRELQTRLTMHFGTYRGDSTIEVSEVFKIVDKIVEEMCDAN